MKKKQYFSGQVENGDGFMISAAVRGNMAELVSVTDTDASQQFLIR